MNRRTAGGELLHRTIAKRYHFASLLAADGLCTVTNLT
jgi:hypothetical protein